MGRKPLDASDDTVRLTIRLTKRTCAQIDHMRDDLSRSEWLRHVITQTVEGQHEWIEKLPEAPPLVNETKAMAHDGYTEPVRVTPDPDLGKLIKKVKVVPTCDHPKWERMGLFDRCTKCDERRRH